MDSEDVAARSVVLALGSGLCASLCARAGSAIVRLSPSTLRVLGSPVAVGCLQGLGLGVPKPSNVCSFKILAQHLQKAIILHTLLSSGGLATSRKDREAGGPPSRGLICMTPTQRKTYYRDLNIYLYYFLGGASYCNCCMLGPHSPIQLI